MESPSPLHSQGLCSSFPEWLLDEVMRLRAREEAAGKRCWPGPSSPGTRLPGLRALPAQRLPKRGPRGPGGEQDSGPNAQQPRSGAPGDPRRLLTRLLVPHWLGPGPGLGLRSHADPGVPAPCRVTTQGSRGPGRPRSTLTPRGPGAHSVRLRLPSCIFLEHESFPATESSRRPPSCARARRKHPWGPSTWGPLRASPGPTTSGGPLPCKAPNLFLTGLPARLP